MPLVNYCKKCRCEVSLGESCPHCGGKLAKTGEQVSFGRFNVPVRNWFCWNRLLRIALPVWLLILTAVLLSEGLSGGVNALARLLEAGFAFTMLGLLAGLVVLILVILLLQGPEQVHYLMDREGVHVRTYLSDPTAARLSARFTTRGMCSHLEETDPRPPLPGLTQVSRVFLPWNRISRVNLWREGGSVQFYHPFFWEAVAIPIPPEEMECCEAFLGKKAKKKGKKKGTKKKK